MAVNNGDRVSTAKLLETLKGLQSDRHLGSEPEVDPQTGVKTKHTIKQDYLPNADWNVNDPDADGYVQGRTHWVERSETGVIPSAGTYNSLEEFQNALNSVEPSTVYVCDEYNVTDFPVTLPEYTGEPVAVLDKEFDVQGLRILGPSEWDGDMTNPPEYLFIFKQEPYYQANTVMGLTNNKYYRWKSISEVAHKLDRKFYDYTPPADLAPYQKIIDLTSNYYDYNGKGTYKPFKNTDNEQFKMVVERGTVKKLGFVQSQVPTQSITDLIRNFNEDMRYRDTYFVARKNLMTILCSMIVSITYNEIEYSIDLSKTEISEGYQGLTTEVTLHTTNNETFRFGENYNISVSTSLTTEVLNAELIVKYKLILQGDCFTYGYLANPPVKNIINGVQSLDTITIIRGNTDNPSSLSVNVYDLYIGGNRRGTDYSAQVVGLPYVYQCKCEVTGADPDHIVFTPRRVKISDILNISDASLYPWEPCDFNDIQFIFNPINLIS